MKPSHGGKPCFALSEQSDWLLWVISMVGATVFVITSKVTLVLHCVDDKKWYGEFMTFVVTLAMGTMFCVTIFQFIPESLHFLHVQSYNVTCTSCHSGVFRSSIVHDDCHEVCQEFKNDCGDSYHLEVGGASSFMKTMIISYLFSIIVYDVQKIIQLVFSNEKGSQICEIPDRVSLTRTGAVRKGLRTRQTSCAIRNRQCAIGVGATIGMIPIAHGFASNMAKASVRPDGTHRVSSRIKRLNRPRISMVERYHKLLANDETDGENETLENGLGSNIPDGDHGTDKANHKQDWSKVDSVAYVILLTTAFECLLEGIAFTLTLQEDIVAGFTVLFAMVLKLVPQKLGNAVILIQSGLTHFWENILALAAVSAIYIGVFVAMMLRDILADLKADFFAALTGMFLYLSLARMFPVLQELVDEPPDEIEHLSPCEFYKAARKKSLIRLVLANLGFLTALGILGPLIAFEQEIEDQIEELICH